MPTSKTENHEGPGPKTVQFGRRRWLKRCALVAGSFSISPWLGCTGNSTSASMDAIAWGQRGLSDGQFIKPRAIAINEHDELFIVDKTARIQAFDREGNFLRSWRTPLFKLGKPCGLAFDHQGHLMVGDTHYHRVLFYHSDGTLLDQKSVGGVNGFAPGEFGFVTDVAEDSQGNLYVGEYGENDRIQKFDPDLQFLLQWGGHGTDASRFLRPQGLLIDENDYLWVADACNHRIQVFDTSDGRVQLVDMWGTAGTQEGQIRYPYGIELVGKDQVLLCEWGNHRIQLFERGGRFLAALGSPGKEISQFNQPWGLVIDSQNSIHVLDTDNHRVQRIPLNSLSG